MKLKEVCEATGLSRKTIRLYEEKGLLVPQKERRNGRDYRDYTEADVAQLLVIASLRKAWFTMEEIRRMQEDPAAIREIFPQYRQWLLAQKSQLDGLIAATEQIQPDCIASVAELSAQMESETCKLPLPLTDVNPHFKYLDEIEEAQNRMKRIDSTETRKKTFRQTTLLMDRDRANDQAITFGQFREMEQGAWKDSSTGAVKQEEKAPLWVRIVSAIFGWGLVISSIAVIATTAYGMFDYSTRKTMPYEFWPRVVMLACIVVYGSMRGLIAYRERQRWLEKIHQQELEKQQNRETPH